MNILFSVDMSRMRPWEHEINPILKWSDLNQYSAKIPSRVPFQNKKSLSHGHFG
jgi:hypothetical protein